MAFFVIVPAVVTYYSAAAVGTAIVGALGITGLSSAVVIGIGAGTISAGFTAARGGSTKDILKSAVLGGISAGVGASSISSSIASDVAFDAIANGTLSGSTAVALGNTIGQAAAGALTSGVSALLTGKDPLEELIKGGLTAGLSTGLNATINELTKDISLLSQPTGSDVGDAFQRATKTALATSILGGSGTGAFEKSLLTSFTHLGVDYVGNAIKDNAAQLRKDADNLTVAENAIRDNISNQEGIVSQIKSEQENFDNKYSGLISDYNTFLEKVDNIDNYDKWLEKNGYYYPEYGGGPVKEVIGPGWVYKWVADNEYSGHTEAVWDETPQRWSEPAPTKDSFISEANALAEKINAAVPEYERDRDALQTTTDNLVSKLDTEKAKLPELEKIFTAAEGKVKNTVTEFQTQEAENAAIVLKKIEDVAKAKETYKADTGRELTDADLAEFAKAGPDLVSTVDKAYTSEDEAKEIWKEKFGTEPTEFDLLEIIGLSEGNASDKVGDVKAGRETFTTSELKDAYKAKYGKEPTESWMNSDEAKAMLMKTDASGKLALDDYYVEDKKTTTLDEAENIWKQMGNTRPMTTDELAAIAGGHEGSAELISKHAFNLDMTVYNGRYYETVEEAAEGARKLGMTQFFGPDGQIYVANPSPIAEANARANIEEKKTFNEAFAAARKELGAGKTFTWNGKQYTTNMLPNDTFDASKSSTVTTAATLAYANGKDKFIGPDGKTYTLDAQAKSVLDNSVNQSAAETQRLLNLKPTTNETPAETQRLMESGTRGTMDVINAMTAQTLGTTQRGFGNFLTNAGKTYAALTGDLNFDNAAVRLGKEIETYAKGNDIYGLDVQKNRLSQAMSLANETDNWIEKTKILGSAIGKNSLGFFDVAGSEVVEELPETILQIGAALMTGGTTLAGQGAIAVIGAAGSIAETFGSTVEETYNKAKKAGDSDSTAMNKAYINGVLSTAIEAGTNYVADKAMLAPFLNKFTGTLAGTATGFVSSTTIGAASELAAGFSQSYATQYIVDPATASLSKAATDGIFEMYIGGTAQGGMSLPGYAIQGGAIIGKDYFGKDLTMADVASGAILNSSTVNPNATIATSDDGDPITLGGAMLQMPNYQFDMSTLKTYVPQVFNNDSLIVGQDELGNNVTFGDLMGETTPTKDFDAVYKSLLDITPEQRTEAKYDYVVDLFGATGYTPTTQEINNIIASAPSVSQIDSADVQEYIASKQTTTTGSTGNTGNTTTGGGQTTTGGGQTTTGGGNIGSTGGTTNTGSTGNAASSSITPEQVGQIVNDAIAGIEFPAGLTSADVTSAIQTYMAANPGLSLADVAAKITDATKGLATSAGVNTAISNALKGYATTQDIKDAIAGIKFPAGLTEADVTSAIKTYMQANPGLSSKDVSTAIASYMKANPGLTKTDLNTAIATATKDLVTTEELAQLEEDVLAEVERNEQAGIKRDEAIQKALNTVAANQKKDVAALTKSISGLGTTLGKEIDAVQKDIDDTETAILAEVAKNEKAGMDRDAALTKAINTVAAAQKKDSAALLAKLGKTETALNTKIGTLQTELAQTERDILAEVARNEAAGMDRDAALQKAINTVAATQKKDVSTITKNISALGASLGKEIDTLQADLDQTERDILAQVALNEKAGMTRDAALQKAINTVAATQQKDSAALLTKLGKTEAALKSEFETKLSGISTEISDTRRTLEEAIQAAKDIGLKGDAALQAGLDSVASNLNITKEALLTQLGTTETALRSEFAAGISDIQTQMQEQYTTLTAGQKTIADNLVAQGKTLEEAIATAKQETAGQIETLTADVQAKYDALTAEQKALANAMNQSGLDLKAAINLAAQQTQAQITGLGQQVDTRINELMQQGQTQQQATQQAISELNTQNQQLQALVGTQGRVATQTDIDVMTQMLGGQRDIDLTYDITGDKKITQDDIDLLTQVVEGSNTDWKAPAGSVFAPTGLYGQLAINEAQRQAEMSAWREREEAEAAEAQRQGKISNVRGTAAKGKQDIDSFAQQLPQAFQQAQQTTTPLYGTMEYFDPFSNPFGDPFGTQKMKIASSTNPADATKIAAGGYIDDLLAEDMSVDDLMNLLR